MPFLVLSLGSNLGLDNLQDGRELNLKRAIELLRQNGMEIKYQSKIYETEPEGYQEQPKFLNMVLGLITERTPKACLKLIGQIEENLGRIRGIKNGPRTIDIDIIFYDQLVIAQEDLVIPHPRMHERAFVLVPLAEILPDFRHPILKKTVAELLKLVTTKGVKPWN
uniref:2-amino-4-hydroxy-6-hydroxymethyldihydropteridine diphosphokinase n=1 Tax=candidate division WOR-3 bacterium TaxID=2052148 RepID=A0A7C6ED00_UNCW3